MNSKLYGNEYTVPKNILEYINKNLIIYSDHNGVKRAKNILKSKSLTYQSLKRLKNFYDEYEKKGGDEIQYKLSGGNLMRDFVEQTLRRERDDVERYDRNTRDFKIKENFDKTIKHNVLCIILNKENKILLLKRSSYKNQWEPNKWSLVGGGVKKNENPIKAINREIKEETNLNIDKFISTFSIMRNSNNIEHIFISKYDGEDDDVVLNFEHSGYGWFLPVEIEYLNTVPNLMEYIKIAITKY